MRWNHVPVPTLRKVRTSNKVTKVEDMDEVEMELRLSLPRSITSQDIWIDCWVSNPSLNQKLKHIAKALSHEQEVTFYMDGSLK